MPQFDNKIFEELRLEDRKAGNKGGNIQTVINQPSSAPTSTNGRSAIGSSIMIEDDKPASPEKKYGSMKKHWVRHAIEKKIKINTPANGK